MVMWFMMLFWFFMNKEPKQTDIIPLYLLSSSLSSCLCMLSWSLNAHFYLPHLKAITAVKNLIDASWKLCWLLFKWFSTNYWDARMTFILTSVCPLPSWCVCFSPNVTLHISHPELSTSPFFLSVSLSFQAILSMLNTPSPIFLNLML